MNSMAVFVTSIKVTGSGVVVEATNGTPEGPPFVRWIAKNSDIKDLTIGKRFYVSVSNERITQ